MQLPDFLEKIVRDARLSRRESDELRKEFAVHYWAARRDLEREGVNVDEIDARIRVQFGDGLVISAEMNRVHSLWSLAKKTIFNTALVIVLAAPVSILVTSAMNVFTLVFVSVCFAVAFFIFMILKIPQLKKQLRYEAALIVKCIVSAGLILNWLGLWFSEKALHQIDFMVDPMSVAGFPFRAIYYPSYPMGSDLVPFDMWPKFYFNLIFWILVGACVFHFIPAKWKNKAVVRKMVGVAAVFSVVGCVGLLLRFD